MRQVIEIEKRIRREFEHFLFSNFRILSMSDMEQPMASADEVRRSSTPETVIDSDS